MKHRYRDANLEVVHHNVADPLPSKLGTFDCALSTGLMHYFSPDKFVAIGREVHKILDKSGIFLFDFSTEVARNYKDGRPVDISRGYEYSVKDAIEAIDGLSDFFDISIRIEIVRDKPMLLMNRECVWNSIDLQVSACKL